jgi:putative colanic acid biosynthesis acetyltransferase WcaF
MVKTDLSKYDNQWYNPGRGPFTRLIWYFVNTLFFLNPLNPISSLKITLLRIFGAKVGKGVRINPSVNIKYPWLLEIGDYTWIGEKVWIDNLVKVKIGNNCCLSQGAMLVTGNHDYKKSTFDLKVNEIIIEDGVWIGGKSVVCSAITCHSHSVLTVLSVATADLEAFGIYRGNPAIKVRVREIN